MKLVSTEKYLRYWTTGSREALRAGERERHLTWWQKCLEKMMVEAAIWVTVKQCGWYKKKKRELRKTVLTPENLTGLVNCSTIKTERGRQIELRDVKTRGWWGE